MEITFLNKKLEKAFNEGATLVKIHGAARAQKIKVRMKELRGATCLHDFWPPKSPPSRCHELTQGQRAGQLSVDLDHPYRLIFVPANDPVPRLADGGLDWSRVTAIKILGIEDTHGN
jgi:proteic killer suppression protein